MFSLYIYTDWKLLVPTLMYNPPSDSQGLCRCHRDFFRKVSMSSIPVNREEHRGIRLLCRIEDGGEGRGASAQAYLKQYNLGNAGERYLAVDDCSLYWAGSMYSCSVSVIVRYLDTEDDKVMNQTWTVIYRNTESWIRDKCVVCTCILVCVYMCTYTPAHIHIYTYTLEIQYIKERDAPQDIYLIQISTSTIIFYQVNSSCLLFFLRTIWIYFICLFIVCLHTNYLVTFWKIGSTRVEACLSSVLLGFKYLAHSGSSVNIFWMNGRINKWTFPLWAFLKHI